MIYLMPKTYFCSKTHAHFTRPAGALLGLIIVLSILGAECAAQSGLTAEVLIGDAVADLGPKYSDVDDAIKKFNYRDVIGARAHLEEAKRKDPTLPPTDLTLAKMYFLTGNAAAGRAALEKTAAEFPNDPEAFLLYADQAYNQGGTIEADALFNKGLQLNERFSENQKRKRNFGIRGLWGRALVAERRKKWADMAIDLQALLKIDSRHAQGNYRLGISLCMQDKFREGYEAFQAAYKENKELLNPSLAIALMYDRMSKPNAETRRWFDQALKEHPNDLSTLVNYSQWLIKISELNEAERQLAAARSAHPDELNVYTLSGVAARMNGKPNEAEQFFVTAHGKAPAQVVVMNQLATLLVGQQNDAKKSIALQFAAMNVKLNPESADANVTFAWVNHKIGRGAEAANALRNGLQLGTLSPDSSYLVAEIVAAQGRPEDVEAAKRILTEALAADNPGIFVHRKEAQDLLKKLNAPR
jgi:predicted Zn-dependent protease